MIYLIIYILGAIGTGLYAYALNVKEYSRIKTPLNFRYWIKSRYSSIFISCLFWFIVLSIMIIIYPFKKIIERINKHYNVEL